MAGIVPDPGAPAGAPQINLPSFPGGPQPPPQQPDIARIDIPVPVRANPDGPAAAKMPEYVPEGGPLSAGTEEEGPAAAKWPTYEPKPWKPTKEFSAEEARVGGLREGLSLGTAGAIAGAGEASGTKAPDMTTPQEPQTVSGLISEPGAAAQKFVQPLADTVKYFGRPMVGAVRMLANSMSSHPDPGVQEAYHRGRDAYMEDQDLQQEQHPVAYLSGQLHGALLGPKFGAFKGLTGLERTERAALAGGTAGALYGAGSSISRGQNVADTITNASLGGLAGGVFGTGGAAAAEGLGQVGSRIAQLYRGRVNPDVEAARRVVSTLGPDIATYGPKLSPYELQVANQAGVPRIIADAGRERTMALVRSAANTSPEGRQALEEATKGRFRGQAERIGAYIRKLAGATGASDDQVALEAAARREVGPRYRKAYKAGDRALWSPRLEQLAGSSAVGRAVPGAIARGQDRAIVDGFGAFNPKLTVTPDGRVVFPKGPSGVPTYPNIQFWDYVQRELRDAADAARSAGRKEEAGAIADIRRELNAELDKLVPEFNDARGAAAAFFGAQDALEAGQKFVMSNANLGDARRALGAMTPAERELFARGFASDLADKIERTGFNRDVLNSIFINNKPALDKIRMALGSSRADQLEALLRVESLLDAPRKAMLNSTTMRQASEMGLAGGAMATYEGIKEHSFNPSHIMAAAFTAFAVRHGAKVIDANVARKVGELLASDNPAELAKGIKIVTSSPVLFDALRRATGAAARVGAHEQGVSGAIAAGSALKDVFEEETHHGAESREDSMSQ